MKYINHFGSIIIISEFKLKISCNGYHFWKWDSGEDRYSFKDIENIRYEEFLNNPNNIKQLYKTLIMFNNNCFLYRYYLPYEQTN